MEVTEDGLEEFFSVTSPLLDERQRRVVAGATARLLGRGGTAVAQAAARSRNTVTIGATEIEAGDAVPHDRVRRVGGGRKQAIDKDPNLHPLRGL